MKIPPICLGVEFLYRFIIAFIATIYGFYLKLGGNFLLFNWNLKANNVLGNEYHTYGVSSAFCQQDFSSFCKRESVYPMPEQTFTFSLSRDF